MTTWVITGSRPPDRAPYTMAEEQRIMAILDAFIEQSDRIITGGAIGIDALAMRYGFEHSLRVITYLPREMTFTAKVAVHRYSSETVATGLGYWARDDMEVSRGDKVLAFPVFERKLSSKYSGTWHTWDTAVRYSKHCALVVTRPAGGPIMIGPEWPKASEAIGAQLKLF